MRHFTRRKRILYARAIYFTPSVIQRTRERLKNVTKYILRLPRRVETLTFELFLRSRSTINLAMEFVGTVGR